MNYSEEEKAIAWLAACTQFEYREKVAILRACGDPALLFGDAERFVKKAVREERLTLFPVDGNARRREADKLISELERKNYFVVTVASEDFPESLKWTDEAPLALFCAGNRELLKKRKFCIVGSRSTPVWAEAVTKRISGELSERFVIVTGLAEGGDSAAAMGALASGNLIAVLPCGLDECYPASQLSLKEKIAKGGLLLSEYPLKEAARTYSFHARNRILAGLSEGVLVVSAGARSGTSITASKALDYGRDVFAFPYNIGVGQGVGCNELLKKGASPVTDSEDILAFYGFEKAAKTQEPLSPEEEGILKILSEAGELHAALIAERAGLKPYEAAAVLSALEVKGRVSKSGGNKYSVIS